LSILKTLSLLEETASNRPSSITDRSWLRILLTLLGSHIKSNEVCVAIEHARSANRLHKRRHLKLLRSCHETNTCVLAMANDDTTKTSRWHKLNNIFKKLFLAALLNNFYVVNPW